MIPHFQRLNVLLAELKRRQVFRAVAVYAVVAWAIIEVTTTVLPLFFLPEWILRVVVGVMVLGFPLVLVLAWAFDLTTQGVQRTEANEEVPQATLQFVRSLRFRATLVLLVVALTGVAGLVSWHVWLRPGALEAEAGEEKPGPSAPLDPSRLAVLYFDDFSQGGELGYLADGITEVLIHELSQVETLEVISRNGVKPFRNLTIPVDSLARLLQVGSIVEGSVEGTGDRMTVTVQLIDGESEAHLMSERIQGRGDDVLALRDSIVQIAVRSLGQTLGRELRRERERSRSSEPEAWALFQRAQQLRDDADTLRWAMGDANAARRVLLRADSLFREASELDPDWLDPILASGWVARTLSGIFSSSATQRDSVLLETGIRRANAALSEDPGSAEALELRGTLRADLFRGDYTPEPGQISRLAEEDLRRAVAAKPSLAFAWVSLANLLRQRGDFEEASLAAQRALEADPFLINAEKEILFILAQVWLDLGEVERAERWNDEGRRRFPAEPAFDAGKLVILAGAGTDLGAVDTAWALSEAVGAVLGDPRWSLGRLQVAAVLAQQRQTDSALAVIRSVREDGPPGVWELYFEANARLRLGQDEEALDLLGAFLTELPQRRGYIARDWWWEPLRENPRFQEMVEEETARD